VGNCPKCGKPAKDKGEGMYHCPGCNEYFGSNPFNKKILAGVVIVIIIVVLGAGYVFFNNEKVIPEQDGLDDGPSTSTTISVTTTTSAPEPVVTTTTTPSTTTTQAPETESENSESVEIENISKTVNDTTVIVKNTGDTDIETLDLALSSSNFEEMGIGLWWVETDTQDDVPILQADMSAMATVEVSCSKGKFVILEYRGKSLDWMECP